MKILKINLNKILMKIDKLVQQEAEDNKKKMKKLKNKNNIFIKKIKILLYKIIKKLKNKKMKNRPKKI